MASTEIKTTTTNSERASFWEDLLRDKYEVHKVEEFNAMGKGKRSRKQVYYFILKGYYFCNQFNLVSKFNVYY